MGQIFEELERRKKGSEPKGSDPNSLIGSGGRMAFAPPGLSWSRRPYSDATHRGASACPCFFAGSNLAHFQMKRAPQGDPLFILVAGARYTNYMQIDLDPFPLAL
jgi:hypothetical protein